MKRSAAILLLVVSAMLFSCKKQRSTVPCDTATLCMVNQTSDTVRYCWGCNIYSEKVAPGEKACRDVLGPINESSTVWVDFETASSTRRVEVADCYVEEIYQ
ncbi:MAG: hypothetical protein V4685_02990 [Bacteroidota bacterium]